ncbi:MAG: DUF309 domain-containing protein [Planctomycetes bacterium]|nr:DUF309 domain-containing protein [Planctomycetota bacterium]
MIGERGGRLFAERRFLEAHEAWEEEWRAEAPGQTRELLRALAQAAAACVHAERGNERGARSLAAKCLPALEAARFPLVLAELRQYA